MHEIVWRGAAVTQRGSVAEERVVVRMGDQGVEWCGAVVTERGSGVHTGGVVWRVVAWLGQKMWGRPVGR